MKRPVIVLALMIAATAPIAALQGCATNPATGGTTITGGMGTAEEIRIGRESHPKIVTEFGGEYGTPELRRYVDSIGQLLARTGERRDLNYKFTVLNSDIVNAFAMPGGYIYITRGLLALADSEAQLAGVLAHELGHITALHHAERQGQGMLANILLAGAGILVGQVSPQAQRSVMQVGQSGAVAVLRGFSRENEYEADDLGIRYLSRAGYQTGAMAGFLSKLRSDSRLQARLRGESPDKVDQFNYLATHPAPNERVTRARARAAAARVRSPIVARDVYLGKIDGILYGDDPEQGFIRGREFSHPKLRFRFEVPEGYRLFNSPKAVIAFGPNKARIIFDRATKPSDGPMRYYLTSIWAPALRIGDAETIRINGLEAATGSARIKTRAGPADLRLVAIRVDPRSIYRFMFLTPVRATPALSLGLRRTPYSFRRLGPAEAEKLKPLHLRVHTVGSGDTQQSIAARMAFADFRLKRFQTMNGLTARDRLAPGARVKIVSR